MSKFESYRKDGGRSHMESLWCKVASQEDMSVHDFHEFEDIFIISYTKKDEREVFTSLLKKDLPFISEEHYDEILEEFDFYVLMNTYFRREDPSGYGYEVIQRSKGIFRKIYHSYDADKVKSAIDIIYDALEKKGWDHDIEKIIKDLPSTNEEKAPHRVLVWNHHHGIHVYDITEPEMLRNAIIDMFDKERHDIFGEYRIPKNETGFDSMKEILALPEGSVKKGAIEDFKKFEDSAGKIEEEVKNQEIAKKILEGEEVNLITMIRIMRFYLDYKVSMVNPEVAKNGSYNI